MPQPDGKLSDGFLAVAEKLIPDGRARLVQSYLRRSISTSYYAVFHSLAKSIADSLLGSVPKSRPNRAWVDMYRGIEHGRTKEACKSASNIDFPESIKAFADSFVRLHDARNRADYNPEVRFSKEDARAHLAEAKDAVLALRGVSAKDRKAFAAWVLINSSGANQGRKDRKERVNGK